MASNMLCFFMFSIERFGVLALRTRAAVSINWPCGLTLGMSCNMVGSGKMGGNPQTEEGNGMHCTAAV